MSSSAKRAENPEMSGFSDRLVTFGEHGWPHGEDHYATPTLLALNGFYYEPLGEQRDRCVCYHCGVALVGWEAEDEPSAEHRLHSPSCPLASDGIVSDGEAEEEDEDIENEPTRERSDTEQDAEAESSNLGTEAVASALERRSRTLLDKVRALVGPSEGGPSSRKSTMMAEAKRSQLRPSSSNPGSRPQASSSSGKKNKQSVSALGRVPYFERFRAQQLAEMESAAAAAEQPSSPASQPDERPQVLCAAFMRGLLLSTFRSDTCIGNSLPLPDGDDEPAETGTKRASAVGAGQIRGAVGPLKRRRIETG